MLYFIFSSILHNDFGKNSDIGLFEKLDYLYVLTKVKIGQFTMNLLFEYTQYIRTIFFHLKFMKNLIVLNFDNF